MTSYSPRWRAKDFPAPASQLFFLVNFSNHNALTAVDRELAHIAGVNYEMSEPFGSIAQAVP
jgi:hypothetical protein